MKKFLLLLFAAATPLFGQSVNTSIILALRNNVNNSLKNSESIYHSVSWSTDQSRKSTGLAIIYSLLLPGMGELYAGSYSSGKYFTIAEGVLWATYIGMNSYGSWHEDRYKAFAASNAGVVHNAAKDEDYYATIGVYTSIDQYNDEKAFERDFIAMYDQEKFYWNWSGENREIYRDMWLSSENAYNNIRFIVGAMIVNRLVSAINAVRLVSAYNKKLEQNFGWNLSMGFTNQLNLPTSLTINFQTQF